MVEGGLDPETAKQTMASQLANQAAPYVAAVAGAGGVVTNKVLNIAGAPKLLNNFIGKRIATPLGQRAARATTAGVLEAPVEGFQEYAEGKLPGMVTGYDPLRTTAAQDRQNFLLGTILGGGTATALTAAGQQGPTVQRAADIDAVGTSPYTAIAAPETTVPVAQIAPPQAAAADVISGKPIITPAPEPVVQLEGIPGQNAVSSLATPPPVVPGTVIAPEVLALPSPTGQVPSVRSPAEFANLQNQRGFDPSQVDTAASQAAAITPDDIGTDPIDMEGADAAARERLASELLQSGTIPNPNALADQLAAQAARNEATADGLETAPVEACLEPWDHQRIRKFSLL